MTGSDINGLKTYLIAHLLPGLANATARRDEYAERERETTDPLDAEYCRNMRKHYQSQVEVWQKNVDEAREMLEEDECETPCTATCEHVWDASYTADDKVDGWDCMRCGAHKDVPHPPGCTCTNCQDERDDAGYHAARDREAEEK